MSADFRALCAELADALDTWIMAHHHGGVPPQDGADAELVLRARTALAQPEPEGLTDKELLGYMLKAAASVPGGQCTGILDWDKEAIAAARAVIAADRARWGRPAIEPVPVAERPWEREGWCDAEGRCWWWHAATDDTNPGWIPATYADIELVGVEFFDSSLPHHALPVPGAEVQS